MALSILTILPLISSSLGILTIGLVYSVTRLYDHLSPGAITPPISLLGCQQPEHSIYQVGFALTGLSLWICLWHWQRTLYSKFLVPFGRITAFAMLIGGQLAAVGVVGQGVITLEENLIENLHNGLPISPQSILHQQLAAIFFLGAAIHCYSTLYYAMATSRRTSQKSCCFSLWSVRIKTLCVLTSFAALPIAEALHPARTSSMDKRNLNIAGLAQYVAVASYILFFGSYSLDFYNYQQGHPKTPTTTETEKTK